MRADLVLGDRERHRPGRIEIDRRDVGSQRRRRLVGLADDDAVAPLDLVVGDRLGERGGNVHHDVALGEDEIHAEQPLERGFELLDPRADGDVEGAQGLRADAAVCLEAVAHLKTLDAFDNGVVVDFAGLLLGGHVFGDDETPAQQRDVRPARPGRELGVGGEARPAAAHLDGRIAEQRLLDALVGALVEYWIGRQRQSRGRARFRRRGGLRRCARRLCGGGVCALAGTACGGAVGAGCGFAGRAAGRRRLDAGRAGSAGR